MASPPIKLPKIRLTDADPHLKTLVHNGIMKEGSSTRAMDRISHNAPSKPMGVNKAIRTGAGVGPRKGR